MYTKLLIIWKQDIVAPNFWAFIWTIAGRNT